MLPIVILSRAKWAAFAVQGFAMLLGSSVGTVCTLFYWFASARRNVLVYWRQGWFIPAVIGFFAVLVGFQSPVVVLGVFSCFMVQLFVWFVAASSPSSIASYEGQVENVSRKALKDR